MDAEQNSTDAVSPAPSVALPAPAPALLPTPLPHMFMPNIRPPFPIGMPPFPPNFRPSLPQGLPVFGVAPNMPIPVGPVPWLEARSPDGQLYYFNPITRETSWFKPNNVPVVTAPNSNPSTTQTTSPVALASKRAGTPPKDEEKEKASSMTPIPGTDWKYVLTNKGRTYYFHPATKKSSWTIPEQIREAVEAFEAEKEREKKRKQESDQREQEEQESANKRVRALSEEPVEEVKVEKAALQEHVEKFKELLRELNISPFSLWDKELPKLVHDPRYTAVPSLKERKSIFDTYCKDRLQEIRLEKKTKHKEQREKLLQLLEELAESKWLTSETSFEQFSRKCVKDLQDARFIQADPKEREAAFKEFLIQLKEKEEARRKEEEAFAIEGFRTLLENTPEITSETNYNQMKRILGDHPRYKRIRSHSQREAVFNAYIQHLGGHVESEEAKREKERREREELSLREREEQVRRERDASSKEKDTHRTSYRRDEATRTFKTILVDLIKSHEMTWRDARRELDRDSRFRDIESSLDSSELQRLLRDHQDELLDKRKKAFFSLLNEVTAGELDMKWIDVEPKVKDEVSFTRLCGSDVTEGNRYYSSYLNEKIQKAKDDFRTLLKETKYITYHTSAETGAKLDMEEVHAILKEDRRYTRLDFLAEERERMIATYVSDLSRRSQEEAAKRVKLQTLPGALATERSGR